MLELFEQGALSEASRSASQASRQRIDKGNF
jgi:hypothetical protein